MPINASYRSALSRRDVLAAGAAAAVSAWLPSPSLAGAKNSTTDPRVAVIGLRGRGLDHLEGLGRHVVAVCDVDRHVLTQVVDTLRSEGRAVQGYADYRRLLECDDIDAVSIATPNHTHALIACAAIDAGKHVYCEKPVSHNVWEGRRIVEAARRHGRIVQAGTQSRSSPSLRKAVAWIRGGAIGPIRYAHGTCYRPRASIGKLDKPLEIPSQVDYDLWCGPAPMSDLYRPQLHYDWHWNFETGNGDLGNQGVHQVDIARWFLGDPGLPRRVLSLGGRFLRDDAGETPNTQVLHFDYEPAPLVFEVRNLPARSGAPSGWKGMSSYRGSKVGLIVQCERGHVLVPSYTEAIAFDLEGQVLQRWSGGGDHYANWLTAVERGDASLLNADIEQGHLSAALCHLGNISHRVGRRASAEAISERIAGDDLLSASFDRMIDHLGANGVSLAADAPPLIEGAWLDIDAAAESIRGDNDAGALLTRDYRRPFVVA